MARQFQRHARPSIRNPHDFLHESIMLAHRDIHRYAETNGLPDAPRTTIVCALAQRGSLHWAHAGDSRMYLLRETELVARTRDHSYSELQEALGRVGRGNEAFNRNVLFTCLGSPGKPVVDTAGPLLLQEGDRILLCSDGLWGTVEDDIITHNLATRAISDAVPELVETALRNGGAKCDNVTVLAMEWESASNEEQPGVSTDSLGEEVFASTIQASVGNTGSPGDNGDADELDEAEIERSIREINEAIRRSANAKKN